MRFKTDEDLSTEVCDLIRKAGHDALSVLDQGMGGATDSALISACKTEARILITLDEREPYGSLPAFSEALATNSRLALAAISRRL